MSNLSCVSSTYVKCETFVTFNLLSLREKVLKYFRCKISLYARKMVPDSKITYLTFFIIFSQRNFYTCQYLYSDNATNFQGADKELQEMFNRVSSFYKEIALLLANDRSNWTFLPPSAPHYGGLWETGVKSVKHHLKRVVGEHTLTFEELSTVLVEIEACLNSRPLGPLSSDIDDLRALTPSYFLNEGVSTLFLDAELSDLPENRLNRFQILQRLRNNFWKRWSSEYLLHLQQREKWRDPELNFGVGQLVLNKDDRYPSSKWPLGRTTEVHPGSDGLVRVVTVKTATTSLRHHVARLCPLRLDDKVKWVGQLIGSFLSEWLVCWMKADGMFGLYRKINNFNVAPPLRSSAATLRGDVMRALLGGGMRVRRGPDAGSSELSLAEIGRAHVHYFLHRCRERELGPAIIALSELDGVWKSAPGCERFAPTMSEGVCVCVCVIECKKRKVLAVVRPHATCSTCRLPGGSDAAVRHSLPVTYGLVSPRRRSALRPRSPSSVRRG